MLPECFFVYFQIFGFLTCMGIILAIGNSIWEYRVGDDFRVYLAWSEVLDHAVFSGFLTFWSYVIILNTVVPISLYVRWEQCSVHFLFSFWNRRISPLHLSSICEIYRLYWSFSEWLFMKRHLSRGKASLYYLQCVISIPELIYRKLIQHKELIN